MAEEYGCVRSFNNNTLQLKLKDTLCNTIQKENSMAKRVQSIVDEILNITQIQIIENLSLLGNQLSYLPNNFTEHIANLVHLNLSGNCLTNLPDCINILKKLTYLSLDHNEFYNLPSVVCELNNLKTLKAHKNQIREVPSNLENLSNLETLDLSSNQLNDLPDSCANLHELKNLSLAHNCFRTIPRSVAIGMENLQVFDFSQNLYTRLNVPPKSKNLNAFYAKNNRVCHIFPNWILSSNYSNLETVLLDNTKFKEFCLPEKPTRSYIKKLSMRQCQLVIAIVEKITAEMTDLNELIIGNTKFEHKNYFWTMPIEKLKEPSRLRILEVCNSGVSMVSNTISKFVNLTEIDLNCNDIFWLPEEICSLKNLNRLLIHNNQLASLPKNIGELISLKELKACCNHLYELPESIEALNNLQYLDLYDNEFETAPETVKNLTNLIGVDLEQNYFSTDNLWLDRDTSYESMRDSLRKHWQEENKTLLNGVKSKLSSSSESSSVDKRKFSVSSDSSRDSVEHYSVSTLPEGTFNEIKHEHWDTSEDSADEFDPHEEREPRKRVYSPFMFYKSLEHVYCPAELHQPRIITRVRQMLQEGTLVWSSNHEEGQFEDS